MRACNQCKPPKYKSQTLLPVVASSVYKYAISVYKYTIAVYKYTISVCKYTIKLVFRSDPANISCVQVTQV